VNAVLSICWHFYDSIDVHKFQQLSTKEVEVCMLAQWIGDFVGRMHRHRITITQIAEQMGVTREYLSMILNGHREPNGIEQRMNDALDILIQEAYSDETA
jgi:hypothetical protein